MCESEGEMKESQFLVSDFGGDVSGWPVALVGLCTILQKDKWHKLWVPARTNRPGSLPLSSGD